VDASEIKGRTGKVATSARSQPSDYILTMDGITSYCEVKSTGNKTSFPFNLLRPSQTGPAKQILAAGGQYWIYVHALALNRWFRIPYDAILAAKNEGLGSLKWSDLERTSWYP
jgi:penicillin-binding protein-related factor A (putative recombinase)